MSIVGTQSVSMSDLMKLGPQALGAMAQGQTQSIAPSYMVIAALKALTDQQKGMMQPEQQGTVVDQLVAEASPQQAGIGAMAPVRGFAEGGFVQRLPETSGLRLLSDWIERGRPSLKKPVFESLFEKEEQVRLPAGTAPTLPSFEVPIPEIRVQGEEPKQQAVPVQRQEETPPSVNRASASATARSGISGLGRNLLETYKEPKAKLGNIKDMPTLDVPKDEYLEAAMAKYGKPDEARMKELRDAEESAGLAAFAKGIMNGVGFGGAFGPAAAEYVNAKESKAEKRRAYEDEREKIALELGLKKGSRDYDIFMKGIDFQKGERDARYGAAKDEDKAVFDRTQARNRDAIAQQELAIRSEANKIASEVRKDGMDARRFERLRTLQIEARQVANAKIATYQKENPTLMSDPDKDRKLGIMLENEYRQLFPEALEKILYSDLGIAPSNAGSGGGAKQYYGTMK